MELISLRVSYYQNIIFSGHMESNQPFFLPAKPAASDPLAIDLYSQQNIDCNVRKLLSSHLTSTLPIGKSSILIVGGRCGLTAQIFMPYASQLHIVEEQPYFSLLRERFERGKVIDYFFGREGFIGERHTLSAPDLGDTKVRVISAQKIETEISKRYDVIVVQNCIVTSQANLIEEFLSIEHDRLITLLIPGKIDPKLFEFFARFQRQIIADYYDPILYQRLQNRRHITGRRQQIVYHQIFAWNRRKDTTLQPSKVKQLLKVQLAFQKKEEDPNPYENKKMVDNYINFHYGEEYFGIRNFPLACAEVVIAEAKGLGLKGRVLDLGCALGRSTIELGRYFDEAVGLDFSKAFVKNSQEKLHELYADLQEKVKFVVGDACNLDPALGKFNVIFGGNLIDRLPDPSAFLKSVSSFLQPNGLLILTSPYTWLESYTPSSKWIGGIIDNGISVSTPQGLGRALLPNGFSQLRSSEDLRFTIKVSDWNYEYTLANVTFWKKNN